MTCIHMPSAAMHSSLLMRLSLFVSTCSMTKSTSWGSGSRSRSRGDIKPVCRLTTRARFSLK